MSKKDLNILNYIIATVNQNNKIKLLAILKGV